MIIDFNNYRKANVVHEISSTISDFSDSIFQKFNLNRNHKETAFDIATLQYLLLGLAHRSQGESHPSQKILDRMRVEIMGS